MAHVDPGQVFFRSMGARVAKTYHQPLTPYERVVRSPHAPQSGKQQLQAIFPKLDPIALLQKIRDVQQELAVGRATEPGQLRSASAESFLRQLRTVWQLGEVRPTHRKQIEHYWRTQADPFESVRSRIQGQLELTSDITPKELFRQLQEQYPGHFSDGQIRTLRRRVKEWRMQMAKRLILSADDISNGGSGLNYRVATTRQVSGSKGRRAGFSMRILIR